MKDRELLITEISEIRMRLQIINSQLYELTLQRVGWTDCLRGLEELLKRCQIEDKQVLQKEDKENEKANNC